MTVQYFTGRSRHPQGALGQIVEGSPSRRDIISALPAADATAQTWTVASSGAQNSTTYGYRISGGDIDPIDIEFTTDASATDAELEAGLLAAHQANVMASGLFSAAASGGDLVLTRNREADDTYSVAPLSDSASVLTITESAPTDYPSYTVATVATWSSAGASDTSASRKASELTEVNGPVVTTTIAVDTDGDTFTYILSYQGDVVAITWDADTDTATTVPIAVAAIEAALPNAAVTGVTGTGVITVALPVGETVAVASESAQGSSTISSSVAAGDDAPTRLGLILDPGDLSIPMGSDEGGSIRPGSALSMLLGGGQIVAVAIPSDATPTDGDVPWVETADGANKGKLFAAASNTRVALTGARWQTPTDAVDPSLSYVRIDAI